MRLREAAAQRAPERQPVLLLDHREAAAEEFFEHLV
jgi:hypothetical protein